MSWKRARGASSLLVLLAGCSGASAADDAAVPSDVRETADAGLATCPGGHAIVDGPPSHDRLGTSGPLYASPTSFESVATSPAGALVPTMVGALVVDPLSGDAITVDEALVVRIDRAGRVVWSTPSAGARWTGRVQLDASAGELVLEGLEGFDRLDVATGGRTSSVHLADGAGVVLTPGGSVLMSTWTDTGAPCALVTFDGTTERSRLPLGSRCGVIATTCDSAYVLSTTPAGVELLSVRVASSVIETRTPVPVESTVIAIRPSGLVLAHEELDASGAPGTGFVRMALDGTTTALGRVPVSTAYLVAHVTDADGTTFVRLGGTLVRIDAAGTLVSRRFAMDLDSRSSLALTADGEVLVASLGVDEATSAPVEMLHFLASDTLEERRTIALPFEACGTPALAPNGVIFVPACDGTMRVLGDPTR